LTSHQTKNSAYEAGRRCVIRPSWAPRCLFHSVAHFDCRNNERGQQGIQDMSVSKALSGPWACVDSLLIPRIRPVTKQRMRTIFCEEVKGR